MIDLLLCLMTTSSWAMISSFRLMNSDQAQTDGGSQVDLPRCLLLTGRRTVWSAFSLYVPLALKIHHFCMLPADHPWWSQQPSMPERLAIFPNPEWTS